MALLRPALQQLDQLTQPLNPSEAAVAQQLERLDDGWTVYIQPRLALDQPDFVAVHDLLGVCVIEVRNCSPGDTLPDGDDPRFCATRTRSVLHDQFFALPSDGTQVTTAVRGAVIMPRCTDAQAAELLGTSNAEGDERETEVWGGDSLRNQLSRIVQGTGCAHPLPESIARLHTSLVASEVATDRPTPAPRSAGAFEIEVNKQGGLIRRVHGASGSGKSFGLAARAAHLAAQGKTVLVLSFNVTLANHLRSMVVDRCAEYGANPTLVTCTNFHSLCTRIVQDAARVGVEPRAPRGARWTTAIVMKAAEVLTSGNVPGYDAVLVDEGQDFELAWWNMLREHLVNPGGEMLFVVDPAQDIYGRTTWHRDEAMADAGFDSPWLTLGGSYRMPADLVEATKDFIPERSVGGDVPLTSPSDLTAVVGPSHGSLRLWRTVNRVGDIGVNVGREVVRLLNQYPSLHPSDVTFICEYHHDGVAAVRQIESAGYAVHHIFSRDPDDARRRRKYRFDPDAHAITGSTIHSFKGWQTTALVLGIGLETKSKRLAYTALSKVAGHPQRPAVVSVINADKHLNDFGGQFAGLPVRPELTAVAAAVPSPVPSASDPDAPAMSQPTVAPAAAPPPAAATTQAPAPALAATPVPALATVSAQPSASAVAPDAPAAPESDAHEREPDAREDRSKADPIRPLVDPTPNAPISSTLAQSNAPSAPAAAAPVTMAAPPPPPSVQAASPAPANSPAMPPPPPPSTPTGPPIPPPAPSAQQASMPPPTSWGAPSPSDD